MQSASVKIDPTEVITQLVPLGANIQSTNGDETNDSQKTLTDDFEKRIEMLENKEINTNG